ncbi:hypothetical protein [Ornithinimicrobium sediminis]|uniref:hypothetical protein n=1 Tax=Ornithinimicrobium sediminis TaxID=2904603 RepID=UPI001E3A9A31|nr:hypothetical protein [Ornithinimicrobium sediminis]MCE0487416.1 hypothetical protein [Ornithinimicrobium sediminis]
MAVRADGLAVVALEAPQKTDDGWLPVVDMRPQEPVPLGAYRVGSCPTWSP